MYFQGGRIHAAVVAMFVVALVAALSIHSLPAAAEEKNDEAPPKKTLTDEQRKAAQLLGLNPDAGGVADVLSRLSGGCDFDPYSKLERYRGGNVQLTPRAGSPDGKDLRKGINPVLACRLVKFFEFANQKGCSIKITSAYRSEQQQADMCGAGRTGCAPAGRSCHQYGLAVDITSSCTGFLRQYLGTKNPNAPGARAFKLHFPYSGDHIQCIENTYAACSPNTKPCDGSVGITAEPGHTANTRIPPSTQFANQVRQWLMPPPMQPAPLAMQPLPQMQGITNAFKEPTQEVTPSVSDSLVKDSEKTGSTTADKLEDLAFGKKKETTPQTATTTPVYIDSSDVGGVTSKGKQEPVTATVGIGGSVTQTTFAINEFGEESTAPATGFEAILASIRDRLQAILVYLRPFGRPSNEAHLE